MAVDVEHCCDIYMATTRYVMMYAIATRGCDVYGCDIMAVTVTCSCDTYIWLCLMAMIL